MVLEKRLIELQTNFRFSNLEKDTFKILLRALIFKNIGRYKNKILVFTELAICGYSPEDLFFHEDLISSHLFSLHHHLPNLKFQKLIQFFLTK